MVTSYFLYTLRYLTLAYCRGYAMRCLTVECGDVRVVTRLRVGLN